MSTNELATTASIAPQIEANDSFSQLDHMINYGRAMFGIMSDKLISVGEAIRHPSKRVAIGETAFALGGSAVGSTVALAQEAPPASPAAANVRFYDPSDPVLISMYTNKIKHCLPRNLVLEPNSSASNPSGKRHNKYARGWVSYSKDHETQTVHIRFAKGYKACAEYVTTLDYEFYFPNTKAFKKTPHGFNYTDPFKYSDPSGRAIESFGVSAQKIHKKHH